MAKRSKDNRILVRIGADSRKRLARNAALEKTASDRAIRREAKKAATRLRRSQREIAKRATQLARRLARERARDARREAKRREREQRRRDRKDKDNGNRPKRKRPFHPRGPYATEKYTSYARRLERSKKLRAVKTSPTTFSCNGYTIKVTAGANPKVLSCTCPDFTQIDGNKNWIGSEAGPFNPCKHMLAVKPTVLVRLTVESRCDPSTFPESDSLISVLNIDIEIPINSYFAEGPTGFNNTAFPCNIDNTSHSVMLFPQELYFDGINFSVAFAAWTRGYIANISQVLL